MNLNTVKIHQEYNINISNVYIILKMLKTVQLIRTYIHMFIETPFTWLFSHNGLTIYS